MALNHAPFGLAGRRALLLADGEFSTFGSKTANCYLRYRNEDVVAVLDRAQVGKTVNDVLGFGGDIPVVGSVDDALARDAELVIVGVAPSGGQLTADLREDLSACARAGLDIVSGLHSYLRDDPEISATAAQAGAKVWDVRWVPEMKTIGTGEGCRTGAKTALLVGSDCNVGKMTTTVELHREAEQRGVNAAWAATGQTGMMLRGRGIAVDRVVADFIGGASEELVDFEGRESDIVFVEGQGSIVHPGFAGVTLGLLYGVMPDCMVLVHAGTRETIGDTDVAMPSIEDLVRMHEAMMAPFKHSPVVAVAVNTADMGEDEAYAIIERTTLETGLPACDPVRDRPSNILDAVMTALGMA